MYKFFAYLFLAAVGVANVACNTPVYECDNGLPLPLEVQVNDCEALPCALPQNSIVVMNATFRAESFIEKLRPQVVAYALGVEVDYPLEEPDGCLSLINSGCPIDEGETIRYQLRMNVLAIFPQISLSMQFTMYDENDAGLVCFMVDARVTAPEAL